MGKRGPAPAPTELKLIRGVQKSRINRAEPKPGSGEIIPPAWLSEEELEEWDRVAPELIRKNVLTSWDVEAFAGWCNAIVQRQTAIEHLRDEDFVVEAAVFDRNGQRTGERLVPNPWLAVRKDASEVIARVGARFGLTPSDRSQLSISDVPGEDDKADLLTG